MKKLINALCALALFASCGITAVAENTNLLGNPGFESEIIGYGEWRFADSGNWYAESENPVERLSDNVVEGSSALHFNNAVVAQRLELDRNVTYRIEFSARAGKDCTIKSGFYDGSQDWPGSYPITAQSFDLSTDWERYTMEFTCTNKQDYLLYFVLWDDVDIYLDDVKIVESENYISRLMTGVDAAGEISFSADYVTDGALFGAALYDEDGDLIGFIPDSESGTFEKVPEYGTYTVKTYLFNDNVSRIESQDVVYDQTSAENEDKALGKASSLEISEKTVTANVGDTKVLDAVIKPYFAYNHDVLWESSDNSVAEVSDSGIVTAKSNGTAVITAKLSDGSLSSQCEVNVTDKVPVTGITLDKTSANLKEVDSVYPIQAQISPENASDKNIVWTSSDESVAVVNNGVITAKGAGEAVITASTEDGGFKAECNVSVSVSDNTITNDRFYKDTDGNFIYSQGGSIYKFGDKYYWYGVKYKEAEEYANNPENGKVGGSAFEAFTCYSSYDLVNWTFEGYPLTQGNDAWIGRMGVAYNKNTKKYVLISQYTPGMIFATSDTPEGPYTIDHIDDSLPIENNMTGDQTVFQDEDGKAYIICSSTNGRAYQYIIPLRDSDFLDIEEDKIKMIFYDEDGSYIDENGNIAKKDKTGIEGNCLFKYNGKYYFTGSDLYGWNSSRVYVLESDDILGDYNTDTGLPYIMNGTRSSFAHNSQAGFYVTVKGSEQDLVIYCGDRWSAFAGNGIGYNQWVPLSFDENGTPYFNNLHQWKLDAEKGTWEIGEGNNYVSNPEFEADRKTTTSPAGWTTRDNIGGYANNNLSGKQDYGNFVWQQTAPEDYVAEISQDITDLPDGTYTLTAWVRSSGGQDICSMYAESSDGRESASLKLPQDEWTEVVVSDNIEVHDGKCTIGLYSDAPADTWVQMDNVRLVKNME